MKNYILIILSLFSISFASAQRAVFGLRGMSTTSSGSDIDGIIYGAANLGYKIKYLETIPFNYDPSTGVTASSLLLNAEFSKKDDTDVLGIAHDYGGIVMKNMAITNNKLSALILDGVPNNGSEAIKRILENDGNGKPRLQQGFNQLKDLVGVDNCPSCDLEKSINTFIESIQANKSSWKDVTTGSPFVKTIPNIPYAIMWGNSGTTGLSNFMSSYISPSNTNFNLFGQCISGKQNEKEFELIRQKNRAIFNAIVNSVTNVLELVVPIKITDGVVKGVKQEGITKFIKDLVSDIYTLQDISEEMKKLLKCQVYVSVLNAQWGLTLSGSQFSTNKTTFTAINQGDELADCLSNCPDNEPDPQVKGYCVQDCYNNYGYGQGSSTTYTYDVYTYTTRPNDGLLTDLEQKLDGAAKVYELPTTNHFQETDWKQNTVSSVIIDLFNGGAGAAFIVPK